MVGFEVKLNVQYCRNSTGNSVHFMFGMSRVAEKLNISNSENSTECSEYLDLQKN